MTNFDDSFPANARPFLASVENGNDVDLRTPFWPGKTREEIASEWESILFGGEELFPELFDLESAAQRKIGTTSLRLPFSEREADVAKYYASKQNSINVVEYDLLKHGILPQNRRLVPTSFETSAYRLSKPTSSGLPLMKKRNTVIEESLELAKQTEVTPAALLGWRGQSSGSDIPKQRVVWMFPYSQNIREGRFFQPVFDSLRNFPIFSAWTSMSAVDTELTKLLLRDNNEGVILSSDFSGFDQSITDTQKWIFDYLRTVYQYSSHDDIDDLEYVLRNIPIRCTSSKVFTGPHGMPSGSGLTNLGDSLINYVSQINSPVVTKVGAIQGDDAVVKVTDLDEHIKYMTSMGLEMNYDKQHVSNDSIHYLQRLHSKEHIVDGEAKGIYPTMRALNSLMGMERFFSGWGSHLASLRTIAILENTKWHPKFVEFCHFAAKGDPLLVGHVKEFVQSNKWLADAKAIAGFLPSYNSGGTFDKPSGLKNFDSVRVLLEMR